MSDQPGFPIPADCPQLSREQRAAMAPPPGPREYARREDEFFRIVAEAEADIHRQRQDLRSAASEMREWEDLLIEREQRLTCSRLGILLLVVACLVGWGLLLGTAATLGRLMR